MQKVSVYDLPTIAFHLIFGLLFVLSFSIGKFVDDESRLFAYHMLSGFTMTFMIILRVYWGIFGTEYAKFKSFKLKPKDLLVYFTTVLKGKTKRELGHNPASSYGTIIMFILVFAQVATGLLMVNKIEKEFFEEVHELLAIAFLLTVILHVAGVIFHQIRHKDGMIFSMFTGHKEAVHGQSPITNRAPVALVIFLVLTFGFCGYLLKNYDTHNGSLKINTMTLQLVDIEEH